MEFARTDLRLLTWFVGILAFIAMVTVAKLLGDLILPVFVSFLVARFLRPYVTRIAKRGVPHPLAILIVTAVCGVAFLAIGFILGYCGTEVASVIPGYAAKISDAVHGVQDSATALLAQLGAASTAAEPTRLVKPDTLVALVSGALGSTVSMLSNGFMILVLVLMILAAGDSFNNAVLAAYGEQRHRRIVDVVHATDDSMRQFLASKSLVNLLSGLMVGIVAFAFGVDLALVFGVLTFFLTFVPAIGGLVALALPIGLAYLQFGGGGTFYGLVAALVVGNMIIERVVEPRIMGKSLDLSPVIVILAFLFFTWLWGAVGALLAVPVTAMMKVFCEAVPKLRPIAVLLREN